MSRTDGDAQRSKEHDLVLRLYAAAFALHYRAQRAEGEDAKGLLRMADDVQDAAEWILEMEERG